MFRSLFASSPALCAATLVLAVEAPPDMQSYVENEVMSWATGPEIIAAINEQNLRTAGASQAEIDEWDATWRSQVGQEEQPLVADVVDNAVSELLRTRVEASGGVISEIFLMDARGLNVAASSATSDYWQGDEAKFSKTFEVGPGTVFVDEVEFDESSNVYQGQISATITDPATGAAIGAITVGLNAEMFF